MTLKRKKRSQAIVLYVDGDQAFAYSYRKRGRGAKLRAEGHSRLGQAINQIEPARLLDDLGGVFRQTLLDDQGLHCGFAGTFGAFYHSDSAGH